MFRAFLCMLAAVAHSSSDGDLAKCDGSRDLDLSSAQILQNNLGGWGPDTGAREIRLGNVSLLNNRIVDLVIVNATFYRPRKPWKNSFLAGDFLQFNVNKQTSVTLNFTFVDRDTGMEILLPRFYFTALDLHGYRGKGTQWMKMFDYQAFYVVPGSAVAAEESEEDQALRFSSFAHSDRPDSAYSLTEEQSRRTVTFLFSYRSSFSLTLGVDKGVARNFLFGGKSSVACEAFAGETFVSASDFEATYIINWPGTYYLTEDIVFEPWLNSSEVISGMLPRPDSSRYPQLGGYFLGFFAAIVIQAPNVTFDCQGHTIGMSEEFHRRQRFFSIFELASKPFVAAAGPPQFTNDLLSPGQPHSAMDVTIQNCGLGLSSHHGIHGNDNHGVVLKNLAIAQFEVGGIHLNGASSVTIEDVDIGPSLLRTYSSELSHAVFLDHLLNTLLPQALLLIEPTENTRTSSSTTVTTTTTMTTTRTTTSTANGDDSCIWAHDNVCDEPTYCDFGTDASDCQDTPSANDCLYAYDGYCDEPTYCHAGTDTADCVGNPVVDGDSCVWANDGICDEPTYCAERTDATDCGRDGELTKSNSVDADSCVWANDGVCDEPTYCAQRTDATDCGRDGAPINAAKVPQPTYASFAEFMQVEMTFNGKLVTVGSVLQRLHDELELFLENTTGALAPLFSQGTTVPDGSAIYGVVLHKRGPAVNGFGACGLEEALNNSAHETDVRLTDVVIHDLGIQPEQWTRMIIEDRQVMGPAGDVFRIMDAVDDSMVYDGDILSDAQLAVGALKRHLVEAGVSSAQLDYYFGAVHMPDIVYEWASGTARFDDMMHNTSLKCDGDAMSHVNKGAVGFRAGFLDGIEIANVTIYGISNWGDEDTNFTFCAESAYGGKDVFGVVFENCINIDDTTGLSVFEDTLHSEHGGEVRAVQKVSTRRLFGKTDDSSDDLNGQSNLDAGWIMV